MVVNLEHTLINSSKESLLLFTDNLSELLSNICNEIGKNKLFIVTDDNVAKLYLNDIIQLLNDRVSYEVLLLPHGEASKSFDGLNLIYEMLSANSASRSDYILNFGGGMITDLGGFAAATYMRGIKYINLPTTLLAMVDSSIGGKTAINFNTTKNLIGAFHMPILTGVYPNFINTLPEREKKSGLGEMIKYFLISAKESLENIDFMNAYDSIKECAIIKKEYVELDEFDKAQRRILNFGHTFGHAFESVSNFTLSHGEAVGLGMLAASELGEKMNITNKGCSKLIESILMKYEMPTDYSLYAKDAINELSHDKKFSSGNISMIFIKNPGEPLIRSVEINKAKDFLSCD